MVQSASTGTFILMASSSGTVCLHRHIHFKGMVSSSGAVCLHWHIHCKGIVSSSGAVCLHWHIHFDGVFKWYSLPPLAHSFQGYGVFKWCSLSPLAHSFQGYSVFKWCSLPLLAPSFQWCLQVVQSASIGTFISMVSSSDTVCLLWHIHFDGVFKWYSLSPLAHSFQGYSVFKWYCLPPLAHSFQGYSVFKWYCLPPLAHSFQRCLPCGLVPVVFVAAENASLQKYCELSRLEDGHYVMVWALFLVQGLLHLQSSHQFGWDWFGLLCLGNFPSP